MDEIDAIAWGGFRMATAWRLHEKLKRSGTCGEREASAADCGLLLSIAAGQWAIGRSRVCKGLFSFAVSRYAIYHGPCFRARR